ncbi:hypothetical protein ACLB2K_047447 [Fragaria x ananassa]
MSLPPPATTLPPSIVALSLPSSLALPPSAGDDLPPPVTTSSTSYAGKSSLSPRRPLPYPKLSIFQYWSFRFKLQLPRFMRFLSNLITLAVLRMEKSVGESNNSLERSKEDLKPKYYMEFDSEIAAFNFYNAYARSEGFSIRRDGHDKDKR